MSEAISFQALRGADPATVRQAIRSGRYAGHTAGLAQGRLQTNLVILPGDLASDFQDFCLRNPQPCPLVGMTEPGSPHLPALGQIDLRTDVPGYCIYRHGELAETVPDLQGHWRDDLVGFALGCSFTFEHALIAAGIPMHHVDADRTVPMYRTSIMTQPAGPFGGGMVVSMRRIAREQVELARSISATFGCAHGAPVHVGDPAEIGIADLDRPDWGDPPCGPEGVNVFWACGVTPQNALARARPPFCITHMPGQMLIADITDAEARLLA